jgi:lipopolysaccharide/colanic/teichoic acid biosynthesis glycosyltransferase
MAKRTFDISLSILLLVFFLPLLLIVSVQLLIIDGWPVFFIQKRIGLNGTVFNIYKFRTLSRNSANNSTVTVSDDKRILPGCNWLRRFKVDELPQLLNVLAGDMSLVGPRPTTPNDVERMSKSETRRHLVRPGITGLAQINGDTSIQWPKRIDYDLQYLVKKSFTFDIWILIQTAKLLLSDSFNEHPPYDDEWGT